MDKEKIKSVARRVSNLFGEEDLTLLEVRGVLVMLATALEAQEQMVSESVDGVYNVD